MPRYPEHLRGFDYTGPNRYFLTLCTHQRARHFVDGQHVALVSEQFQRSAREQAFAVIAYVPSASAGVIVKFQLSEPSAVVVPTAVPST